MAELDAVLLDMSAQYASSKSTHRFGWKDMPLFAAKLDELKTCKDSCNREQQ
jgi:hypothetical protein